MEVKSFSFLFNYNYYNLSFLSSMSNFCTYFNIIISFWSTHNIYWQCQLISFHHLNICNFVSRLKSTKCFHCLKAKRSKIQLLKKVHLCGHIHTRSPSHNCCCPNIINFKFFFIIFMKPITIALATQMPPSYIQSSIPSLNPKSRLSGCPPTKEPNQFSSSSKCSKSIVVSFSPLPLGGALIVKSMNSCGCTKGVLIVPRGYQIYIRYGCFHSSFCKNTRQIIHILLVVFLYLSPQSIIMKWVIYKRSK